MAAELRRFVTEIGAAPAAIASVLEGRSAETEAMPGAPGVPLLDSAIAEVAGTIGPNLDRKLLEPLHRALPITRRSAADPRLWQWLCLKAYPEVVWQRWWSSPAPPAGWQASFSVAYARRFGCRATLNGISRNTLARLWWVAESFEGDYDLARRAIANQDLFQAIFERRLGLYPPAARACLLELEGRNADTEIRPAVRWLQFSLGTTVLQTLDEEAIRAILREALPAVPSSATGRSSSGGAPGTSAVHDDAGRALDAHFAIRADGDRYALHYESSGGKKGGPNPRNLDYQVGITLLLERLALCGAVIEAIHVDSQRVRKLPEAERVVGLPGFPFPLAVDTLADIDAFRAAVMTSARKVGQDAEKQKASGGSSRALAFLISGLDGTAGDIQAQLAGAP